MMTLFILFTVLILLIAYFKIKDRRYLKKSTREVVSDDIKKLLNIPTPTDEFPSHVLPKVPKMSPSTQLLRDLNDDDKT